MQGSWKLCAADIKALDQAVFDSNHLTDHLIRQKIPGEVAHDLMYVHNHVPFGAVGERDRLDMRIDRPTTVAEIAG